MAYEAPAGTCLCDCGCTQPVNEKGGFCNACAAGACRN